MFGPIQIVQYPFAAGSGAVRHGIKVDSPRLVGRSTVCGAYSATNSTGCTAAAASTRTAQVAALLPVTGQLGPVPRILRPGGFEHNALIHLRDHDRERRDADENEEYDERLHPGRVGYIMIAESHSRHGVYTKEQCVTQSPIGMAEKVPRPQHEVDGHKSQR